MAIAHFRCWRVAARLAHTFWLGGAIAWVALGCGGTSPQSADVAQSDAPDAEIDAVNEDDGLNKDTDEEVAPTCGPGSAGSAELGEWRVEWQSTGAWKATHLPSATEVRSAPIPALLGQGEPAEFALFGAFHITWEPQEGHGPGVSWHNQAALDQVCRSGHSAVELALADGASQLRFSPSGPHLRVALLAEDPDVEAGALQLECGAQSAYFGLGTQVTGLNLRGHRFPLWSQEQGIGKPEGGVVFPLNNYPEAAYAPMGVWHASEGWSAVVGSDGFGTVDLCRDGATLQYASYPELPELWLSAGASPLEQVERVTTLTGRMPHSPEPWWFGPWHDAVGGPDRLIEVADIIRDRQIPSSAIWTEDWIGNRIDNFGFMLSYAWEWDDVLYPELPANVDWLNERGFAFLGYFNPFVPSTTRMWEEGVAGDFLVRLEDGELFEFPDPGFRPSGLIDFTNPEARAWMAGYLEKAALDVGLSGWMADFAEWLPSGARMHDGTPGWLAHNPYTLAWQRLSREVLERTRGEEGGTGWVFFSRSGWASAKGGAAASASVLWAGDQETNWLPDDGFPTVIPIGVHAGLCGVAMYGSDIAGYSSYGTDPTSKELFFRWASHGALTPVMRTHHGSWECRNWSFDRDEDTLLHFRRWASIHVLLLPMLTELAEQSVARGWPIMRHPWLHAPHRPELWEGEAYSYFLGPDLFVAPVLKPGLDAWTVRMPGPGWWPLFGKAPIAESEVAASAPATELPAYVRPGAVLHLLSRPVDTTFGAGSVDVTSLLDAPGGRLALYPDASGEARFDQGLSERPQAPVVTGLNAAAIGAHWSQGGAPLPSCEPGAAPHINCVDAYGAAHLWLEDGIPLELDRGAAQVRWPGAAEGPWVVGVGAEAWGEWALPTPIGELNPMIPPPCEVK